MSAPPSAPPGSAPPGVPPMPTGPFVDPSEEPLPERAVLLVAPVTTFFILAILCIGLRIWAKRIKKTSFRFSDYAILVAAVFGAGYLAICWLVVDRGGVGFPLVRVAPPQRSFTQKSFVVAWLLQTWANTFVRLSILDFIGSVFSVRKFRYVVYVFEGFAVAYLVACTITFFAICRPMRYNFVIGPQAAQHCGNLNLKFLLSAIFNLVLDVCILVLPMPMLMTLQLNSRKKASLLFVFSLGIFVCFATAWRTYNVIEFSKPASRMNFTMTVVEDALWSGLEINLGIINACLPVMPPALQHIFNIPFFRLLTFSTWRSSKPSAYSSSAPSGGSKSSGMKPSWLRIGSSKGDSSLETGYSVDLPLQQNVGSTTKLAGDSSVYRHPDPNQYYVGGMPAADGHTGSASDRVWVETQISWSSQKRPDHGPEP